MIVINNIEEMAKYYNSKTNTYEFVGSNERQDVKFTFDLRIKSNIYAGHINAWNIDAEDIKAGDIDAWDINAGNIDADACNTGAGSRTENICPSNKERNPVKEGNLSVFHQEQCAESC